MPTRHAFYALVATLIIVTQLDAQPALTDRQGDSLPAGAILRMGSVRMRHADWVQSVHFSPDGKLLASADSNYTVRLWDVKTNQLKLELPKGAGSRVAYSPDGKVLATGGYYQKKITIWDASTGERLREMPQNGRSFCFTGDGKLLAAAGQDAIVRVWNVATGEEVHAFKGHKGALFSVAISRDGKLVASGGGGDGTAAVGTEVRVWSTESGKQVQQLQGHTGWVYDVAFSHDRSLLASVSPYEGRVWDLKEGKERQRLERSAYSVAFSPMNASHLATANHHGIYESATGKLLVELKDRPAEAQCLAWSPDATMLATGDGKGRIQLWDAATGREISRDKGHTHAVRAVAFSLDGSIAASASAGDKTLRIWGLASGAQLRKFDLNCKDDSTWYKHCQSIFFPPDGKLVGTYTSDGLARFWVLADVKKHEIKVSEGWASVMAMSRDGNRLAVAGSGSESTPSVRLVEVDGVKELWKHTPFTQRTSDNRVSALAFSPNGKLLAMGVADGGKSGKDNSGADSIQLWDVKAGKKVLAFRKTAYPPATIGFSPDGKWLVAAATGQDPIQIWDAASGTLVQSLGLKDVGRSWYESSPFAFSPDSKVIAAATVSREIVLYEVATGREMQRFKGHSKIVTALAFSPDGRTLLSGSEDATVLLWDVGRPVPSPTGQLKADDPASLKAMERCWDDLADADPTIALRASRLLLAAPDRALALIRERLQSAPTRDIADLPKLIEALTGDGKASEKAAETLKDYGVKAAPALFEALRKKPGRDMQRRIELTLEAIGEFPISPSDLRRSRSIRLLEQLASPEAERILIGLSRTHGEMAEDARAAIARLEERRRAAPVVVWNEP